MVRSILRNCLSRWSVVCVAPFILAGVVATPVLATGPIRVDGVPTDSFVLPAGDGCAFELLFENTKGAQDLLIWEHADGSVVIRIVGPYFARLTNTASGESIEVSLTGPAHIEIDGEFTLLTTGRWVFAPPGGDHGVWLVSGLSDASNGASAGLDSLRGHAIDVCAALS
jgi:hypothetical protein